MGKKIQIRNSTAEFLIFTNQAREDGIEVRLQDDTIWLSQKLMSTLFDCSTDNIGLHLKNIYNEGELDEKSTTELFSVVATNGKTYNTKHYNLDAFLQFNEYELLNNVGHVSAQVAKAFAESEFEKYRIIQDRLFQSDFDKYNSDNLLDLISSHSNEGRT